MEALISRVQRLAYAGMSVADVTNVCTANMAATEVGTADMAASSHVKSAAVEAPETATVEAPETATVETAATETATVETAATETAAVEAATTKTAAMAAAAAAASRRRSQRRHGGRRRRQHDRANRYSESFHDYLPASREDDAAALPAPRMGRRQGKPNTPQLALTIHNAGNRRDLRDQPAAAQR
jgi:hypothetical protein